MQAPSPQTQVRKLCLWPGAQRLYLDDTKLNHVCFAGVGWGKSHFGVRWAIRRLMANRSSSSKKGSVIAPTLRHLKRHHFPVFKQALATIGLREYVHYTYNRTEHVLSFIEKTAGFSYEILFVTMENWQAVVGWEFDWAWWDEPGFGHEELKEQIDERVGRAPGTVLGQILYTGVVQHPNWYYEKFGVSADLVATCPYSLEGWVEEHAPGYGGMKLERYRESEDDLVLHASSFENPLLEPRYFDRLWAAYGYKTTKYLAHVIGRAIAVNTHAVYPEFSEAVHVGDYKGMLQEKGLNTLNLTFDFNVGQMSALVVVASAGNYYVVWENSFDCQTTKEACAEFRKAFPPEIWGNWFIHVYGDPAGYQRSPQYKTREGNYSIIKHELLSHYPNLKILARRQPYLQEYRVESTNRFMAQAKEGGRGLYADWRCRKLITGWRKSSWDPKTSKIKKGSEDTETHAPEAFDSYLVVVEPPVEAPQVTTSLIADRQKYPRGR